MRFIYIDDGVPEVTTELLRDACARKQVEFIEIPAANFPFDPDSRLEPGDMMYRAGITVAAQRVEHHLSGPGIATFYASPAGALLASFPPHVLFARAGVPTPRTIPAAPGGRHLLESHLDALGGFPLVIKVPGGSGGIGTMLAESWAGLNSLLDYLFSRGDSPLLCSFIADAVHWRLTVIGSRAAACYRNLLQQQDFRTFASEDSADFTETPPGYLADLAVQAASALGLEFGGVDILEHPSGRCYVLEVNFPCFFAQAQTVAGIDIAGAMIEHLLAKSLGIAA